MYYDMSGFDYGILDVVQVLHLRKRRGNYYDCPFCGETHGKTDYFFISLHICTRLLSKVPFVIRYTVNIVTVAFI
ncbi:hypothetical protein [Coprococcus comes]|uniref:hypothetical protein n=1 Tax=Coprococcus comes TaxID=410072 RepID=UPI00189B4276|nr:hypothetical protein [Coprococcus comes]